MSEFDTNPLFELIKSLSGPEKRYFKLFASRHIIGEANVYVSLFNILDGQKTYDEKKIFISEKKIKKSQFHNIKKYLYDIILKSLNSFHINDSNETKLRHMVHQVKILYERGLYEQAKKIIRKAKKIAIIHEHYTIHIDLLLWERAIYNNTSGLKKIEHHLIAVSKEEKNLIENLKLLNEVKAAQDIIFSISIQGKNRIQKEKMKKQWPLLKNILKKGESGKLTFDMWRFVYNACSLYYRAMDDPEKTYYYNKKMVELHDGDPERYMHAIDRYLTSLHNHLIACEEFKRDEIPMILEKLKKINDTHPQVKRSILLQSKIFQMSAMSQMDLVISKGDFKSGVILINKEIKNRFEKYENVMPGAFKCLLNNSISDIFFGVV